MDVHKYEQERTRISSQKNRKIYAANPRRRKATSPYEPFGKTCHVSLSTTTCRYIIQILDTVASKVTLQVLTGQSPAEQKSVRVHRKT